MSISKNKEVTSERLEEFVDSSTSSKPLLGKDDPGKAVVQGTVVDKNDQRKEFSISLSSKEIEEDFYIFTGTKPNLKPKKRPKVVQKQPNGQINFQMSTSKDREVTNERLEELDNSSTSSKPLLENDDPGKTVVQETVVDKNDRRKEFSISLSRKEIEEDFRIFTGTEPNPKPKKRPKVMQKQHDAVFPKQVEINFQMPISKDEEVTSERMEEFVDSSTLSRQLLRNDDPCKAVTQGTVVDKNDRRKEFSISLSSKEIEEDFYIFTGTKPNPKPKKRPIVMQKQLNALFPKQVEINFQMPISKGKEVTSEKLEELVDSSTSSKPLLGKDDLGKAVMPETVVDKNDRQKKFSISLSSKEIEEDLLVFKGIEPNLKPKRRPKVMQKQLDALFPGSGLSEITKDKYKVAE